MDKEEFRIKLEEINRLVEKKDYRSAMEVVDSIDWRRVKNVHTLCVVGEIYAANKRYEDSKEIFLLAYHRAPIGKNILYRLIEISLKMKDVDEATDFYEEYLEIAPNDSTQYVLKYKIDKVKNAPIEEQIKTLEEYKDHEFTEKWSYELAKLYYQNGEKDKCLDICNEMILWFSEGKYVMKAMELKEKMGELSESEKESYETQAASKENSEGSAENKEGAAGEDVNTYEEVPAIDGVKIDQRDVNNAESLQEKISKGIRDVFNGIKKEADKPAEFSKEEKEEDSKEDDIQEEMLKDIKKVSEKESEVQELEPETSVDEALAEMLSGEEKKETEDTEKEDSKEEKTENAESASEEKEEVKEEAKEEKTEASKLPELEMPEEMENLGIKNPLEGKDVNLEDMILAAASAQGIDIPETTEEPEKEEPAKEEDAKAAAAPVLEDDEEPMTEEDLQAAEAEFLNGPSGSAKKETEVKPLEDEMDIDDDFSAILEDETSEKEDDFLSEDEDEFDDGDFLTGGKGKVDLEARKLEKFIDSINKKEPDDNIIPREKKFTEEETKLFTYFAKVPGLKEQIINTLCEVQLAAADKTSKTGNIIVMGGRETGKTRLISGLIPAICKELNIEASKVAYVFADQINGKDPAAIVSKMAGGFLVIENANQLKKETVNQLNKAMEFRTDGLIIILEDEKIAMRKLIARFPKFTSKFTSMINIPVFTNDELVNFAKVYTKENGYTIDQMGMLALYNRISMGQKADQPMSIGSVKEIIDSAISKSQGGIRKLKKKKVNLDGFVVLYEKDFN